MEEAKCSVCGDVFGHFYDEKTGGTIHNTPFMTVEISKDSRIVGYPPGMYYVCTACAMKSFGIKPVEAHE